MDEHFVDHKNFFVRSMDEMRDNLVLNYNAETCCKDFCINF